MSYFDAAVGTDTLSHFDAVNFPSKRNPFTYRNAIRERFCCLLSNGSIADICNLMYISLQVDPRIQCNTFQDLPRLRETADNIELYI